MTVKNAADIVSEMIAAMAIADPELDTSIGSIVNKLFDVVGEQIAPAYAEQFLAGYVFDIDVKSDAALDDFVTSFGINRLAPTRATGVVTFTRGTDSTTNILVPANTQVSTANQIVFATVAPATLVVGTKSVSVPVQAVRAGEEGNLPADALTLLTTQMSGINPTVSQGDACTGGTNAESDAALRKRFKNTIFRSLAGTEDMFAGVAIEDTTPNVNDALAIKANIIGASKFWREQVQVVSVGGVLKAVSTIPPSSVQHVYSGSAFFGQSIDNSALLAEGVHYTFDTTVNPPEILAIGTNLIEGTIYDLQFEYSPQASRNDPAAGITNRVDIWVSGVAPTEGKETTYFRTQPFTQGNPAQPLDVTRFVRLSRTGEVSPTAGNQFLPLAWGPIIDFPQALTVGAVTYLRDTDYWVVHDDTGFGYGPTSKFGLEWLDSHKPALDAQILLTDQASYFYNALPRDVQARAAKWKLVTTDLMAHAAKQVRLVLNLAVMYSPSYDKGVVQTSLDSTLANWLDGLGFASVIQVSDILAVAHGVSGVDNVRFLNSLESVTTNPADVNDWGIQQVSADGTHLRHFASSGTPARAQDIVLADNQVPVLFDIRYLAKAQNSFNEPG